METDVQSDTVGSRRKVNKAGVDTSNWPTPDAGALSESELTQYLARQAAVDLYLAGSKHEDIQQRAGIGLKQVYRLIRERCLATHPDGQVYGWRGLVPHARVHPYRRNKKLAINSSGRGASGAMTLLLQNEPELAKKFLKRILGQDGGKKLKQVSGPKEHAIWFVDQLRKLGYETRNEWPFNTEANGYYAVFRHIKSVLDQHPRAAAAVAGGPDLVRKLSAGDGVDRPVKNVFGRVEMDAHKLDGRFCVHIPQLDGGSVPKIIHRLWVIVILEVTSRAVLGYHLSLRYEVSKDDVLRAIKSALTKWTKRDIYYSDEPYREGAALPSGVRDDWVGLCWDETSVDGALAETCPSVRSTLGNVVGSQLLDPANSFAVRRSLDDRPFIEAYFRNLAGKGFQKLTNTTGSSPKGRKGRDPDEVALSSEFQYEYAEELLDVLITNYNVKGHGNLGNHSPLQYLHFITSRSDFRPRFADPALVSQLCSFRLLCTVKGGAKEGRAPYVNFVYGKYTNEVLSSRHDLVGQKVWVINHLEWDARLAMCSTSAGQSLGILRASPPWHKLPHSLSVRRSINAFVRRGKFSFAEGEDGTERFLDFVESNPKLPVYPAYLEARRILVAAAEEFAGESMVTIAKTREKSNPSSAGQSNKKTGQAAKANIDDSDVDDECSLPARRMAAI
jgi:hypothetical protein